MGMDGRKNENVEDCSYCFSGTFGIFCGSVFGDC